MVDAVEQEIGEEGFETELNAEGAILVFCLGQSADDEHGNIGGAPHSALEAVAVAAGATARLPRGVATRSSCAKG